MNPSIFKLKLSDEIENDIVKKGTKSYPKSIDAKVIMNNVNDFLGGKYKRRKTNKKKSKRKTLKRRKIPRKKYHHKYENL
jgi:hypothetical protein